MGTFDFPEETLDTSINTASICHNLEYKCITIFAGKTGRHSGSFQQRKNCADPGSSWPGFCLIYLYYF